MSIIDIVSPPYPGRDQERLAKIIVANGNDGNGARFYSEPSDPLQVAVSCYPAQHEIRRHYHPGQQRPAFECPTQEVVIVQEGAVLVELWDSCGGYAGRWTLRPKDVVVFYSGSHAFLMLEPTVLAEVKQGPYDRSRDKEYG